jgi:hypothetical protein
MRFGFLAAFALVLYHYADQGPVSLFDVHPAFERGYLATNFFLMLSGYVLARAYGERFDARRISAGRFLLLRVARIWPAHLIMVGAFVALFIGTAALGISPEKPPVVRLETAASADLPGAVLGLLPRPFGLEHRQLVPLGPDRLLRALPAAVGAGPADSLPLAAARRNPGHVRGRGRGRRASCWTRPSTGCPCSGARPAPCRCSP